MKMKASMLVMSHLSDAQEMLSFMVMGGVSDEINFAKFVILYCDGDLNKEVDPDKLFKLYLENQKRKG